MGLHPAPAVTRPVKRLGAIVRYPAGLQGATRRRRRPGARHAHGRGPGDEARATAQGDWSIGNRGDPSAAAFRGEPPAATGDARRGCFGDSAFGDMRGGLAAPAFGSTFSPFSGSPRALPEPSPTGSRGSASTARRSGAVRIGSGT